ncbi:unnamed protein product [Brachionus calyciflorus]|uniref:CUB domain-containing protein n=1 Tax=Brachionus calyciflorus TaxID=104777 RepID=A0A813M2J3_9BILA|nr:unnamed protein product [Brachionus calyciflorus]
MNNLNIVLKFSYLISKICNCTPRANLFLKIYLFLIVSLTDFGYLFPGLRISKRFTSVSCIEKVCGEFYSEKSNSQKGIFEIDRALVNSLNKYNETLLCIYKFIARKNEKVLLNFSHFEINSQAPECMNEYIDTYIEVNDQTLGSYVETNFLSRWCGWKKPYLLVSYHNIIIIAFHTDGRNKDTYFKGTYEFINADIYNNGRKSTSSCTYEFKSDVSKSGMFMSPTYPGTYPNILNCSYRFIGRPDERIQIDFEEILIHFGADHCPYDVIKLYDYQKVSTFSSKLSPTKFGLESQYDPNIKYEKVLFESYCGRKLNFTVFSTNNIFEIEFEMFDSLGNEEYSEDENKIMLRKGFKAFYKFSNQFADLSFITGTHITGTNCDQKIKSSQPNGIIYSPNFYRIHPINASCKYIFEGLDDSHNLESVKLNFYLIDVKQSTAKNICNENNVSHFVVYGSDRSKSKYCFNRLSKEPRELKSLGAHMTLIFNSINVDHYTPSNFKASYNFYTEFGIEGTRVYQNRTCLFVYNSESVMYGTINSPRYPQNYPLNIRCTYIFELSSNNERILFTFKDFKLDNTNHHANCSKYIDNLSIYQTKDYSTDLAEGKYDKTNSKQSWTLLNRFCGNTIPTPIISDENAKTVVVTFYSDSFNYAQGFLASYDFLVIRECKYHYFTNDNLSDGKIIIKNEFESTYNCDWYIKSEPGKSFLLAFKNENLVDTKSNQFVIRIYDMNENLLNSNQLTSYQNSDSDLLENSDEKRKEVLREKNHFFPKYEYTLDNSIKHYQIDSTYIRIQLVIGKDMSFNNGRLILSWLAAKKSSGAHCKSNEFMCNQTKFCIKSTLFCDGIEHCPNDFSDEPEKCFVEHAKQTIFPAYIQLTSFVSSIVVLVFFLFVCLMCRVKSVKKSKKKPDLKVNTNPNPLIYYKYSPANSSSSNSIDFLEAAITSV